MYVNFQWTTLISLGRSRLIRYLHPKGVLSRTGELTPYHYWNGKKPDLSKIRIFGSRAFIRDPLVSSKLEARSQEGVFVGRSITQNAFRIYIPSTKRILISKDVKVDETMVYHDMKKQSVSTFFFLNL